MPQTHSGMEDQDSPTDLRQEKLTVVVMVVAAVEEEEEVEEMEEDSRWQQEIQTMVPR